MWSEDRPKTPAREQKAQAEARQIGNTAPEGRPGLSTGGAVGGEGAAGGGRRQGPRLGGLAGLQEGAGCRGQGWAVVGLGCYCGG